MFWEHSPVFKEGMVVSTGFRIYFGLGIFASVNASVQKALFIHYLAVRQKLGIDCCS